MMMASYLKLEKKENKNKNESANSDVSMNSFWVDQNYFMSQLQLSIPQ